MNSRKGRPDKLKRNKTHKQKTPENIQAHPQVETTSATGIHWTRVAVQSCFGMMIIAAVLIWAHFQMQNDDNWHAVSPPGLTLGQTAAPLLVWRVVNQFPHDPQAFTQGLTIHRGELFENTGLRGQSSLRRVALTTGRVLQQRDMSPGHFGEGITVLNENIYQLTWQAGLGFVYDRKSFKKLRRFRYEGDGWGLTHDGKRLVMSDGTAVLRFLDPETLEQTGSVQVSDGDQPIGDLNELEYVRGRLLANVWRTDTIVRIRPEDGQVDGWLDMGALRERAEQAAPGHRLDVFNGIAWDDKAERLFVTGKRWPLLFEIEILDP